MKDVVDLLNQRIAELEDQITEIPTMMRRYEKRIAELEAENERLREKIESNRRVYAARDKGMEKDAERYRWAWENGLDIEDRDGMTWITMEYEAGPTSLMPSTLADNIDAAMEGSDERKNDRH